MSTCILSREIICGLAIYCSIACSVASGVDAEPRVVFEASQDAQVAMQDDPGKEPLGTGATILHGDGRITVYVAGPDRRWFEVVVSPRSNELFSKAWAVLTNVAARIPTSRQMGNPGHFSIGIKNAQGQWWRAASNDRDFFDRADLAPAFALVRQARIEAARCAGLSGRAPYLGQEKCRKLIFQCCLAAGVLGFALGLLWIRCLRLLGTKRRFANQPAHATGKPAPGR